MIKLVYQVDKDIVNRRRKEGVVEKLYFVKDGLGGQGHH